MKVTFGRVWLGVAVVVVLLLAWKYYQKAMVDSAMRRTEASYGEGE